MATAVAGAPRALVGLGARLGLIVGQQEALASLNPADYVYAVPSDEVLKRLARQEQQGPAPDHGNVISAAHTAAGARASLQGAAPLPAAAAADVGAGKPPAHALALSDDLFGGQLDLDDDCLRLLLGEDADETAGPCVSAAGSGKGPAAAGSGASQKSSATGGALAAAPTGDAEAASMPTAAAVPAGDAGHKEEDDDIAMLFGEYREPLDLHLLGGTHQPLTAAAADSGDTASAAGDPDADLSSPSKRAKGGYPAAPAPAGGLHLALSMDYDRAAESINLELLGGHLKAAPCGEAFDAMLPLLSPIMMDFGGLGGPGVDTPESPDSLASGSDTVGPMPPPLDSAGKRKRAVHA